METTGELSIPTSSDDAFDKASHEFSKTDSADLGSVKSDAQPEKSDETVSAKSDLDSKSGIQHSRKLAIAAAQVAAENGGQDIKVLDMTRQTPTFDFFVIATGTSRRQLHAMSEDIDHKLEDELNDKRMNIDGYDESRWIVLDYATVVIHLFDEETRAYYSLESLWADADEVNPEGLIHRE